VIDGITSQTSLTRFTLAQIASILSLVDLLKGKSFHDAGKSAEVVFDRFFQTVLTRSVCTPCGSQVCLIAEGWLIASDMFAGFSSIHETFM
jgi:hypothetical protein